MHPIKAILFDFGGTLFDFAPSNYEILGEIARKFGKKIVNTDPLLSYAFQKQEMYIQHLIKSRNLSIQNILTKEDWLECDRILLETIGVTDPAAIPEIMTMFQDRMYQFQVYTDTVPTLEILYQKGLKLGIISNLGNSLQIERRYRHLKEYKMCNFMETVILSGEHNVSKPDPAIFELALKSFPGIKPQETIYVGDSYLFDVIGARNAGMIPVLLD